jgi:ATP-dependent Clp protease ATP-binding subunit ClpA
MMNKIFRDLKENIKKTYNGSNIITINKFFHHSFNYAEMIELYQKYKGNVKKAKNDLFDHINQYEAVKKQDSRKRKTENFGLNPSISEMLEEQFNDIFNEGLDPNLIYQDQDLSSVYQLAQSYEVKKLQRTAQETGQVIQPDDISISSFLRAIINIASGHQKYSYLYKIIKDSGFDIDKFIKDDDLGKSRDKKLIDKHCTNLNKKAKEEKLQPVIGRELEIEQLVNILKKARKNNPVLVGKAGVGKTAIVEGLAKRIVEKNVPDALRSAVIYELRVMDMVKGTSFRGQFEQNMSDLLEEFKDLEASGEIPILFIDELHTIMGAGGSGQGGLDFSNIIKPALARGELRTIGATTTDEWYKFIKENPALDRRFVAISINEPSAEDALKILEGSLPFYEKAHGVTYQKGSLERAIDLSQQFIVDNALPDKAFDLVDYAGAMAVVKGKKKVEIEDIEYALARHKNINLEAIMESRKDHMEPLAPKLKKVIFGQDFAVEKVCRTVEKAIAGLNAKDKPYGAFLFTGPTGTGKTELAKQIAKTMKAHFYRLDMSEFTEPHSVAKLIGSPPGYVGYDDGSSLTKVINEHPRTVLLLDEIEKAHPDVYKLLLQIMDYGKLTDSKGREINFRNVLLIMTSNAGTRMQKRHIGFGPDTNNESKIDKNELERLFAPEFRARLTGNGPIEFSSLTEDLMNKIVDKYIQEIQEDRLNKLRIKLSISNEVKSKLSKMGLSKDLGARPVKDYIENEIIEPLTDLILFGNLKGIKKDKEVKVTIKDGKFELSIL